MSLFRRFVFIYLFTVFIIFLSFCFPLGNACAHTFYVSVRIDVFVCFAVTSSTRWLVWLRMPMRFVGLPAGSPALFCFLCFFSFFFLEFSFRVCVK